jgi:hypothetical protein
MEYSPSFKIGALASAASKPNQVPTVEQNPDVFCNLRRPQVFIQQCKLTR